MIHTITAKRVIRVLAGEDGVRTVPLKIPNGAGLVFLKRMETKFEQGIPLTAGEERRVEDIWKD
jgi:hypothetical protein